MNTHGRSVAVARSNHFRFDAPKLATLVRQDTIDPNLVRAIPDTAANACGGGEKW